LLVRFSLKRSTRMNKPRHSTSNKVESGKDNLSAPHSWQRFFISLSTIMHCHKDAEERIVCVTRFVRAGQLGCTFHSQKQLRRGLVNLERWLPQGTTTFECDKRSYNSEEISQSERPWSQTVKLKSFSYHLSSTGSISLKTPVSCFPSTISISHNFRYWKSTLYTVLTSLRLMLALHITNSKISSVP
jgi:hypothetical protein